MKIGVQQSNQKNGNEVLLVCGGIIVAFDFTIKGKDKNGIDGNYDDKTAQRIVELQNKIEKLSEEKKDEN
jgi:methylmalonyl-CoA mutase cobalamin-binding subunit